MRLVKSALFGLLVVALGAVWANRTWVVDAYRSERSTETLRLSGVDLAYRPTDIAPSPYVVPRAPDTRAAPLGVRIEGDPTTPTPPPSLGGGGAVLDGTVVGPEGPVAQAVVRIERHTDAGAISVDVTTDDEGGWRLGPVAGGRYRVRSWLPGVMTMGRSEVRYVADDQVASFEFSLWGVDPTPRFEFVHAGPLYHGVPGTVAVVLGWRSIDQDGLVVTNPVPGAEVTVEATAQVDIVDPMPVRTDGTGTAWIRLRCVPPRGVGDPPATDVGLDRGRLVDASAVSVRPIAVGQEPAPVGPAGSLTARSGQLSATFELPGCRPLPPPEEPAIDG